MFSVPARRSEECELRRRGGGVEVFQDCPESPVPEWVDITLAGRLRVAGGGGG